MSNQIHRWLKAIGLAQYADVFAANDIDFRSLSLLTDADLRELGVTLGHRRILLDALRDPNRALRDPNRDDALALKIPATPVTGSEAERRQLTVVFCDLVGSTELSRTLDPEELREVIRHYQNVVTASIVRHEGYVAKFLGDGVLAYFGWPQANEEQVEHAIRAALGIVTSVSQLNLDGDRKLQVRIGIETGQVVVGDLVGDLLSDAEAVIGQTPNMAARLQGIAEPGQTVIGAGTRALLGASFELENLGPHHLKGFAEPVQAWNVLREHEVESRFEAYHGGQLTSLVGRDSELGLLHKRWERANRGEGQVVLLSGEAGIGKSRIIQDLADKIGNGAYTRLAYQCSSYHSNNAFYPVIQHVRRTAGFANGDDINAKLDKLETYLQKNGIPIARAAPIFASLLSLPSTERYAALDVPPQQIRNSIIELLVQQIIAQSESTPILCIVEDAHWCDQSMSEFIGDLIPRIADRSVCLLITFRPEYFPPWKNQTHVTKIAFKRLGQHQAAQIVQSIAGTDMMDTIVDQIVTRSDGVPLYVEELTKSVLETIKSDGLETYDVIPKTLQSSLVARLDRLYGAKETAQVGAVIGREFTYRVLRSIMSKPESELLIDLDRLVKSGLINRHGTPPDATYKFKHALVQDAAYTTILKSRRRTIHARIVKALEELASDEGIERLNLLAHHADNAELWEKAFSYRYRSGKKAMERSALHEAAAQFEQTLEISTQHPEAIDTLQQVIDLRLELRNALWPLGQFELILTHLTDAERLANQLGDPVRTGWISVFRSASLWQLGRSEEALQAAENSLTVANAAGDQSLEIAARFYLGCVQITAGVIVRAEQMFESVVSRLTGELRKEQCGLPFAPAVIARSWLVWALAERGEFESGLSHGSAALELAIELEQPFNLAHIYYDLGYLYEIRGEIDHAVDALQKSYDLVNEWSLSYLSPFITGFLGHAYALSGKVEEGLALLQQARSGYNAMGLGLFRSLVGIQLGEALLLADDAAEASVITQQSVVLAENRGELGHRAYGLRIMGDIAAHPDQRDVHTAMRFYTQSLESAERLGMRPLSAHCHSRISKVCEFMNDVDRSAKHASLAARLSKDLGVKL